MNRLDASTPAVALNAAAPRAAAPAGPASPTSPALAGDRAGTGLDPLLVKLGPAYAKLLQAAQAGDAGACRQALAEIEPLIAKGRSLAAGSRHEAAFAKVAAAAETVRAQLPPVEAGRAPQPAAETRTIMVGLPGRGGRMVAVEAPQAPVRRGPLAWFGDLVGGAGKALTGVMHVAFAPLTFAGKLLDPIREGAGKLLGGAKAAIDGSIGQVPVLGQAVRFTTGLASSLVGLVDGALHGITHPVELVQGLGHMAWTVVGLVPGVRTAWDVGVNGMSATESLKASWGEAGTIGKAFFQNAIDDVKAGNWSGALGRVTGDIGSFFVTGGAAAGAKTVGVGSTVAKASRLARLAEVPALARVGRLAKAAKLDVVAGAGVKAIRLANEAGATIMIGGLKTNLAAWRGVGRLVREVPAAQRVMTLAETSVAKFRGVQETKAAGGQVGPAAAVRTPKQASPFTPAQLAGEVQVATPLTREQALARQVAVLKELERSPALNEALYDAMIGRVIDADLKFDGVFKGLKLEGKAVTSMEEAAAAWKALPADSPLRVQVGKQLAAHMQQAFQEGLGFPPAAVEFRQLADNLAGQETRGKVLIDPAILHEDLDFLVHVMAEEQTHAYQRFLVDNQAALPLGQRMTKHVDDFAKGLSTESYVYPPTKALTESAERVKVLSRGVADHADDVDYRNLRLTQVKQMLPGSVERAAADAWWAKVDRPSKEISLYKYAQTDLKALMKESGSINTFRADYVERLPKALFERDGVRLTPAETAKALDDLIKQRQQTLAAANGELERLAADWKVAYESQTLEFVAQRTADEVAVWIMRQ